MFVLNLLLICVIFKCVCPQICNTVEHLGNIRITNNGRVIVCVLNENGSPENRDACFNDWDGNESVVACSSSGYSGVVSDGSPLSNLRPGIIISCEGSELNLSQCNYSRNEVVCQRLRDLECYQLCSDTYPCPNSGVCKSDNKCECIEECQNGGYCQAGTCICLSGYHGDTCELCPECQNGGSCLSNGTCECSTPFYGDHCENKQCDPSCQNNGTCINGVCECVAGYTGDTCENIPIIIAVPSENVTYPIIYAALPVVIIILLILAFLVILVLVVFLFRYRKNKTNSTLAPTLSPQNILYQNPRNLNCQSSVDPKVQSDCCIYEEIEKSRNYTSILYSIINTPMNNTLFNNPLSKSTIESTSGALSSSTLLEENSNGNAGIGELGILSNTNRNFTNLYQTYEEASQCPYTESSMVVPRSGMRQLTTEVVYTSLDTTISNPSAVEIQTSGTYFNQEEIYWEPPKELCLLFDQMSEKRFREIDRSAVELQDKIGSGQFGQVYKALWHTSGSQTNPFIKKDSLPVAVKTLHSQSTTELQTAFIQEAAIMGQFSHPNVLRLLGIVSRTEPFMIVTELMHTELLKFLFTIRSCSLQRSQMLSLLLEFSRQITSGMTYLSSKNFIHRDLAARNVLVGNDLTCRISDFAMSRQLREEGDYYTSKGGKVPLKWTSPEAIFYQRYSEKSDVWSIGMTLYEIWTLGEKPWYGYSNDRVVEALGNSEVMDRPNECPAGIWSVMVQCWEPNQELRPTFEQVSGLLSVSDSTLLDELSPIET